MAPRSFPWSILPRPARHVLLTVAWAVPLVVVGATLMASHWVTLPTPERSDPVLGRALADLTPPTARWRLVHVLYGQCRCSQRIFAYLLERPRAEAEEMVILVDDNAQFAARAQAAGYAVEVIDREALKERFGIESAPLLIIAEPGGALRYVGGYTPRKQGADYRDVEMLAALQRGDAPEDLPLYGCGVSRELQAYLDPIGVKYRDTDEDLR